MISNKFLVLGAILTLSTSTSAYFLSWGSAEQTSPAPAQYYYHKRLMQGPGQGYTITENGQQQQISQGGLPVSSVPIQTPLHAQLSPLSNVHRVQLVPCMCPVSQDYPFDNYHPQQENIYVPVQHVSQQSYQQLQMQQPQIQQSQLQQLQQSSQQQQQPPK